MRRDALIRSVTVYPLRIPLKSAYDIAAGVARQSVDVVIVSLQTEDGIIGLGETQAWHRQGSNETLVGLVDAMQSLLIPLMLGQSIFDIATIARRFDQHLSGRYAAKAALLDALYDAQGHMLNLPVWALLGGRARPTVATGAVLTLRDQLAETLEEARLRYDQGYRHFSLKVGRSVSRDIAAVAALRDTLGDDAQILIDANAALSFSEALRLLQAIEPYAIEAAEQPLASHDWAGLADLASRTSIPLLLDESVTTPADLLQAIPQRVAQGIHTKTAKNGGIWHTRQLWHIASSAGWRVRAGNHPATSISTLAVAHLATAWAEPLIPSPFTSSVTNELASDVVSPPLAIADGELTLHDGVGWGVELDMNAIARWRID
ncbi:mandelate racemase/muconate lactonizing enzyme family protein [Pantoea sp. App145]|uniref:mandelate racemase/muconate lactonizing enzyme family protein n=1 Tax=Pantoea sp. App145 TaxID=3071567 RepID=UPI003A7F6C49